MFRILNPLAIVGALPVTLTNGTVADANQVMSDLQWIVDQVNANAAPLASVALLASANTFTQPQSGVSAVAPANFPLVTQVQNNVFNTLTSNLGTDFITARTVGVPITAYAAGQSFTFIPTQVNGDAVAIRIDGLGSTAIRSGNFPLMAGMLQSTVQSIRHDGNVFQLGAPPLQAYAFNPIVVPSVSGAFVQNSWTGFFARWGNIGFAEIDLTFSGGGDAVGQVQIRGLPWRFANSNLGAILPAVVSSMGSTVNAGMAAQQFEPGALRMVKNAPGGFQLALASDLKNGNIHLSGVFQLQ